MDTVTDVIGKDYAWEEELPERYLESRRKEVIEHGWAILKEYDNYDDGQKNYGGGNCVFISAPTGSGKTHFILNIWLPYMAKRQEKILYLVNRRILKEDINERKIGIKPKTSRFIDVKLYQDIETELKEIDGEHDYMYKEMREKYSQYACVVCDECHYFLADSNYNVDTALSFRCIQEWFAHKIRIFMSATIKDIKPYIKAYDYKREFRNKQDKYCLVDIDSKEWESELKFYKNRQSKYYDYNIDREYNYLDIHIMSNEYSTKEKVDSIAGVIEDADKMAADIMEVAGKEKWLIFVDTIDKGKKLEERLRDKDAVFISSRNKKDKSKSEVVDEIITNEKATNQIIIATSVLDNGINLKDDKLRNVILMADTETEFIQMLGRKRKDQKRLKLYIYPNDRKYFENRLNAVKKKLKIAKNYVKYLEDCKERYRNEYNEDMAIKHLHIKTMRKISDNNISIEDAKSLFNVYGGILYLNLLAYQNIDNLYFYYKKVIEQFDEYGEDAFVKIQLGWLGIEGEKADEIIADSKRSKLDVCREKVIDRIKKDLNRPLSKAENIKLKAEIKKELMFLLEAVEDKESKDYNKALENIKKTNDRPITPNIMEYLYKNCGIPYEIVSKDKYIFSERKQPET